MDSEKLAAIGLCVIIFVAVVAAVYGAGIFLFHKRYVGAYYYLWCDKARWASTGAVPLLGEYRSDDEAVMRQHLAWIEDAGIDFLAVSWWGIGSHMDKSTEKLFKLAEGSKVQLAIMVEAYGGADGAAGLADWLGLYANYSWQRYVPSASYFRLYDKPLLLVYLPYPYPRLPLWDDARFTVRYIQFHSLYNAPQPIANPQSFIGDIIPIIPGCDVTWEGKRILVPRRDGETYRENWNQAILIGKAQPFKTLVALITSWNEYPEQTAIEPTQTWQHLYLTVTRDYAGQFKSPF